MADSLTDKAEVDMSTVEGLRSAFERGRVEPKVDNMGFKPIDGSSGVAGRRKSMLEVTHELNGGVLAGEDISMYGVQSASDAVRTPGVISRAPKVKFAGIEGRRKSMSEYLNEEASTDYVSTSFTSESMHEIFNVLISD